jgi:hypothetical protein
MAFIAACTVTLALCAGVSFGGVVYASDGGAALSVQNVWLDEADTLHIQVTDAATGVNQALELNLRDYAGVSDEYVSVQAVDRDGNKSNAIQFKNPYYVESAVAEAPVDSATDVNTAAQNEPGAVAGAPDNISDSGGVADGSKPLTPDGTGSVIDNVNDGDGAGTHRSSDLASVGSGKEFFSIKTEDGNTFYLIVDRQRAADNVYLLNAVTEGDLASLAKPGDGMGGGVPSDQPVSASESPSPSPTPEPPVEPPKTNNGGALIFIALAALAAGGAGYYFKIVKPRKDAGADDEPDYDEPEEEAEYDDYEGDMEFEDGGEDGGDGE